MKATYKLCIEECEAIFKDKAMGEGKDQFEKKLKDEIMT